MASSVSKRYQGEVIEWSDEKRCGFIRPRGSTTPGHVVFLPAKAFPNRNRPPKVGDIVTYETIILENSPKNRHLRSRTRAENACFLGEEPPISRAAAYRPLTAVATIYLGFLFTAGLVLPAAKWTFVACLVFSFLSFVEYARDKRAAQKSRQRIPESGLHLTALLGGWPGAAVAQHMLRHKTQKRSFQTAFRWTALFNAVLTLLLLWLLYLDGLH